MGTIRSNVNNLSPFPRKGIALNGGIQRSSTAPEAVSFSRDDISALTAALGLALAILHRASPEEPREAEPAPEMRPAVSSIPISESVEQDFIICLEDGARVKYLKSYLKRFGLTPDQYRVRWGLPAEYPMVAPAFSAKRSELARRVKPHLSRKQNKSEPS